MATPKPQADFSTQVIDRAIKRVAFYLKENYGVDPVGAALVADRIVLAAAKARMQVAKEEKPYLLSCDDKVSYLVVDSHARINTLGQRWIDEVLDGQG